MRRGYSGHSIVALDAAPKAIMSVANFDGKHVIFECRGILIRNSHVGEATVVDLYDQDAGAIDATAQRGSLNIPADTTAMFEFAPPGKRFYVNLTALATDGTVAAYHASAWGYEVGGE